MLSLVFHRDLLARKREVALFMSKEAGTGEGSPPSGVIYTEDGLGANGGKDSSA